MTQITNDEKLKNAEKIMYKKKNYNTKTIEEITKKKLEEEKQKKEQQQTEELRNKVKSEILKEIERLKRIKKYNIKMKEQT